MGFFDKVFNTAVKALPTVIGYTVGGPWGAAIGSAISTDHQGGSTSDIFRNAALTYAGSSFMSGSPSAAGASALDPIEQGYQAMQKTGAGTFGSAAQGLGYSSYESMIGATNPGAMTATGRIGAYASDLLNSPTAPSAISEFLGNRSYLDYAKMGGGLYSMYQSGKMMDQARQMQDPYTGIRNKAIAQMSTMMDDPSRVADLPGYGSAIEATKRRLYARGFGSSGNLDAALLRVGNDLYQQEMSRLRGIAGMRVSQGEGYAAMNQARTQQMSGLGLLLSAFGS